MQPLDATALPGTVTQHLSVFELFLQSDSIVKLVLLLLLAASFWSWAIIFDKSLRIRRLQHAATSFEETFWSGGSLDDLFDRVGQRPHDPMSSVFAAAMREWRRSAAKGLLGTQTMRSSLQQRIERVMNVTVGREMDRVERFMSFLATVGSTAPFVGLFGTVYGIMDAFIRIDQQQRRQLSAGDDEIADRELLIDGPLDDPLVDALVAPRNQHQPGITGELGDPLVCHRLTLRRQVNHLRRRHAVASQPFARLGNRALHRFGEHHHTRPAAIRAVVDAFMTIRRVIARVPTLHREQAALLRAPDHADLGRSLDELGLQPRPVVQSLSDAVAWFREMKWL